MHAQNVISRNLHTSISSLPPLEVLKVTVKRLAINLGQSIVLLILMLPVTHVILLASLVLFQVTAFHVPLVQLLISIMLISKKIILGQTQVTAQMLVNLTTLKIQLLTFVSCVILHAILVLALILTSANHVVEQF